ncbi:TIGR03750 family conjugal transfer protein [Shewanella baltica]|uniref:TIGR03750 family conjugal transfer protein n=1 Tax=Shewanella baltica TaxID=62322 RepID=UPI00217ED481|nr:TIGR03750 family conjugal transfer protein [Shewanella baltica]MCS6271891.1 TIGR03750 family conjugal transfer protein [Shewanella baltica]
MKLDENDFTDSFTGDFLNEEPVVFKGLTDSEVKMVFVLSLFIGAPIGVVLALVIGIPTLILVFVLLLPIISVWFIAGWMESARRGKPSGYVEQRLHIEMVDRKLTSPEFICQSYKWGLGRTKKKSSDL